MKGKKEKWGNFCIWMGKDLDILEIFVKIARHFKLKY